MSGVSLRWTRVGTERVPYLELGDAAGPPVVLLPGLTDGLAPITTPSTRELIAGTPLRLERIRALVVSHRASVAGSVTTRRLAADTAAVLDGLLGGPAVLVGHSMGAMVAQHLAADRPDLVRGLVLTASSARPDGGVRAVLARWDGLVVDRRFDELARVGVDASFTGAERRRRRRRLAAPDAQRSQRPTARGIERHLVLSAACASHDALARLGSIDAPALVLAGADDVVMPAAHARRLAAGLVDARLEVFPGLGHGFPEQDPECYAGSVEPFLDAVLG